MWIPARSGSKSIKDKNLQKIGNWSLLSLTVAAARVAFPELRVFVDTDSDLYAAEAKKAGAEVPFLRKSKFSGDLVTDSETLTEFLRNLKFSDDSNIVHLRPTTPLREPLVLRDAMEIFLRSGDSITALRSVEEMPETAYKSFLVSQAGFLESLPELGQTGDDTNLPRQAFPKTFACNGYIDVIKKSNLNELGSLHGNRIRAFQTSPTIEIDSEFQLHIARSIGGSASMQPVFKYLEGQYS